MNLKNIGATETNMNWQDALTKDEIRDLVRVRDWRAWLSIVVDWGLVGASDGKPSGVIAGTPAPARGAKDGPP